ncbi:diaminopimelate decarboxylase [Paremcibacter congregatus]|uniref:Diaminopimelate decarboxylase n=1 Tax=Paremcibacter congregatus TaxID=2043170 RepID=A0A2G4YQR9_9PROT|nr:diaminopimelate decarboxylase [Paremcibacter congregatus]PHZ84669.1 diaminopimelate decarboxylase [Paremcibacter congregatus]QDE28864.1 diaminopimelate decarboxylase [Paremcibacter congregatus]
MDSFAYRHHKLHAEDFPLERMAQEIGTPFYCYSTETLIRHHSVFCEAFTDRDFLLCYAVKANTNQAVIKTLADQGAGADVVSEGELRRALKAGIPADKIVYSGVAKTKREMAYALEKGIFQFNVESEPELYQLNDVASRLGKVAAIAFRINPDVDAKTHAKIATGRAENKFGVPLKRARAIYADAAKLPGIRVQGVDLHIGSQLTDLAPFEQAFHIAGKLVEDLRRDGHDITVLDLGGGLGIPYDQTETAPPLPHLYGQMAQRIVGHLGCKIICEPGRLLVGNAGILVSEVIYVKKGEDRNFLIIDAAMNDLIRPSLYEAYHEIVALEETGANPVTYDIVGPVCETGDTFAQGRTLPELATGDLVAIRSAGAYGAVMASTYNTRRLIPEVLVKGDSYAVIRPRPDYEDIIGLDVLPDWLD